MILTVCKRERGSKVLVLNLVLLAFDNYTSLFTFDTNVMPNFGSLPNFGLNYGVEFLYRFVFDQVEIYFICSALSCAWFLLAIRSIHVSTLG